MDLAVEELKIAESNGDLKNQGFVKLLIGFVHASLMEYDELTEYCQKSTSMGMGLHRKR